MKQRTKDIWISLGVGAIAVLVAFLLLMFVASMLNVSDATGDRRTAYIDKGSIYCKNEDDLFSYIHNLGMKFNCIKTTKPEKILHLDSCFMPETTCKILAHNATWYSTTKYLLPLMK